MTFPPTQRTPDQATTGVFRGMPFRKYARLNALNASTIAQFIRSSKRGAWYLDNHTEDWSPAKDVGSLLHTKVLEPKLFKRKAIELDIGPTAKVAYRKAHEQYPDRIIVRNGKMQWLHSMAREIYSHPVTGRLLRDHSNQRELTVVWTEKMKINGEVVEVPCKARLDLFSIEHLAVFDLKKLREDGGIKKKFSKSIYDYGYHIQAAWYARAAQKAGLCSKRPDYAWICVEESPPHEIDLYQADAEMMRRGWSDCKRGLYAYTRYRITGEARGRSNSIEEIELPAWAKREE